VVPLLIVPGALALRLPPDHDGGSGMISAAILVVAMPVAAGATVWATKGDGDSPRPSAWCPPPPWSAR
jgi:BASS family bile acid:Na+ symporter